MTSIGRKVNVIISFMAGGAKELKLAQKQQPVVGSGCGSVGRAVAFDTRGPQFNSSHRQNFIEHLFIINCIEKTKINQKRPGMAHFKKTNKKKQQPVAGRK